MNPNCYFGRFPNNIENLRPQIIYDLDDFDYGYNEHETLDYSAIIHIYQSIVSKKYIDIKIFRLLRKFPNMAIYASGNVYPILHHAINYGNLRIVKTLMYARAHTGTYDYINNISCVYEYSSAIHIAIACHQPKIVQFLINNDPNTKSYILKSSGQRYISDPECLPYFDDMYVDGSEIYDLLNFVAQMHKYVHNKTENKLIEIMEMLIKSGCDVNCRDTNDYTPIMTFMSYPNTQLYRELLIKYGADINCIVNRYQNEINTPLAIALANNTLTDDELSWCFDQDAQYLSINNPQIFRRSPWEHQLHNCDKIKKSFENNRIRFMSQYSFRNAGISLLKELGSIHNTQDIFDILISESHDVKTQVSTNMQRLRKLYFKVSPFPPELEEIIIDYLFYQDISHILEVVQVSLSSKN
ncbi:MAG: hypothetical protein Dasosvirus4_24 [Dasosvirus sp.]|uniref:Uncharacterized protein n=1 Tax=Dasosvirus sp. TaxID=2487764 RepID=A0A3G4ZV61_9VIRU|nr:MAG: hypothetical protein Dasosvirus4_24 [Dasosvirus sp.]